MIYRYGIFKVPWLFHDFWWFFKVPWLSMTFPENFTFPGFPDPVGTLIGNELAPNRHLTNTWTSDEPVYWFIHASPCINYLISPGQNGCHFADDIFNFIFMNEKLCILIRISLKFAPKGPVDNKSALVQAWCRTDDKPLCEPMLAEFTNAY